MAFVPVYILILFTTIIIDYIAGILIEGAEGKKRKVYLIISIVSNIGILVFFKYYNFLAFNIDTVANAINWNYSLPLLSIILPIGLSFHTFQALSYTIEVYRRNQKAERHFGIYALYVMFFPQLVAGPIERPQQILHQFHDGEKKFDPAGATAGLKRMAQGFFKKVVVADHLAIIVNIVFANVEGFNGPVLIFATICFAFQLYCDFSGYSDIALGSAQVLGFKLMENFERPYFSKSIAEFWRRWHISLSSWLRDYVYYPLAFKSRKPTRTKLYAAVFLTFLLSGIWHGAGWNYAIMGAIFGFYISFSLATKKYRDKFVTRIGMENTHLRRRILSLFRIATTFAFVCVGWVFFRAKDIHDAFYVITHWFDGLGIFILNAYSYYTWKNLFSVGALVQKSDVVIALLGVLAVILFDMVERGGIANFWQKLAHKPTYIRWGVYYGVMAAIIICGVWGAQDFIYFQF